MKRKLLVLLAAGAIGFSAPGAGLAATSEIAYDYAGTFSEGYGVIGVWEGRWKYGYINRNGATVIQPQYDYAGNFSEGVAAVGTGTSNAIKYGFIKTDGSVLIKPQFDYAGAFANGYAVVGNKVNGEMKYGIVDAKGAVIAKPVYINVDMSEQLVRRGYAAVRNENYGIVNLRTKHITEVKYASVLALDSYIRTSQFVNGKEKYGMLLANGKTIEPTYDWIHYFDAIDHAIGKAELNGKFGVIDRNGAFILELKYEDIRAFGDGTIQVKLNGKYGYVNSDGTMLTKIEYEEASAFTRALAVVKTNGKWGVLRVNGTYAVEPRYDQVFILDNEIQVIENGKKRVLNKDGSERFDSGYEYMYPYQSIPGASKVKKDGKEIIIDESGQRVFTADFDTIGEFENGVARITLKDKVGYLRTDGTYLVQPIYDSAYQDTESTYYHTKDNDLWGVVLEDGTAIKPAYSMPVTFRENIGVVRIGQKYTYIDDKGKRLTQQTFDYAEPFYDGVGRVGMNGKTRYVNDKGVLLPGEYLGGYDFSDGYACVHDGRYYRFIDPTGKLAFNQASYLVAQPFSNGMAVVMGNNGKWGYIDTDGVNAIPFQYDGAFHFGEQLAPVRTGNKFGFIDKSGKTVIAPTYEYVSEFENGIAHVWKDKKHSFVTSDGKVHATAQLNGRLAFFDGIAAVRVISPADNRAYWGFMKQNGTWLVEPQFDHAQPFYDGTGTVYKDGKSGKVSKTGKITWD